MPFLTQALSRIHPIADATKTKMNKGGAAHGEDVFRPSLRHGTDFLEGSRKA